MLQGKNLYLKYHSFDKTILMRYRRATIRSYDKIMFFNHQKVSKVACNFLNFDWCKILNGYVNLSFNILSMRRLRYQPKSWKTENGLNKTWITSNSLDL